MNENELPGNSIPRTCASLRQDLVPNGGYATSGAERWKPSINATCVEDKYAVLWRA
jgi:hypothetical protein